MNARNPLFRGICACLMLIPFLPVDAQSQTPPQPFVVVTMQKVAPANAAEYEKLMTDNWKPLHQLRKQNGKITSWALYRVCFSGAADEYNYVSAMYYDSFVKSEPDDNYPELMKAANPKSDAAAIMAQTTKLRTIQRQVMYARIDATTPAASPKPLRYLMINFMQPKPGMASDYIKNEREDFKPLHQAKVDQGQMVRWSLFRLAHPWGTYSNHLFVTSDAYSSYSHLDNDDEAVWKKINPGKDLQGAYDKMAKARDVARTELWELVTSTN